MPEARWDESRPKRRPTFSSLLSVLGKGGTVKKDCPGRVAVASPYYSPTT